MTFSHQRELKLELETSEWPKTLNFQNILVAGVYGREACHPCSSQLSKSNLTIKQDHKKFRNEKNSLKIENFKILCQLKNFTHDWIKKSDRHIDIENLQKKWERGKESCV